MTGWYHAHLNNAKELLLQPIRRCTASMPVVNPSKGLYLSRFGAHTHPGIPSVLVHLADSTLERCEMEMRHQIHVSTLSRTFIIFGSISMQQILRSISTTKTQQIYPTAPERSPLLILSRPRVCLSSKRAALELYVTSTGHYIGSCSSASFQYLSLLQIMVLLHLKR